ncbi:DsbA family protein [Alteromonas sp. KUL49]|uniref:DsbA family protein n=1 Tax=Alteromonas sp. KUL49 TaxID=2480798 RepID=UPI0010FFB0BE|nr:DsbA family protein [Alteromonas sp. KUL49]GEA10354.1 DsbA family protein [Alteromonas sp. KUL49]
MRFLYVMDPMCAWCYGFQPEFEAFIEHFPSANVEWIMGGLAPDTTEPMQDSLKNTIAAYWYQIEEVSQVTFNHSYWELNTPYRSTYKACRAVISAEALAFESAQNMVKAIQTAYYREAKNPSLETTLMECARSLRLDEQHFLKTLHSSETERKLQEHLSITRHFQVSGFPALFYINDSNQAHPLTLGFCKAQKLLERFALVSNE